MGVSWNRELWIRPFSVFAADAHTQTQVNFKEMQQEENE